MDRMEGLETGKKKSHNTSWGQCTKPMQQELKACANFEDVEKEENPIELSKSTNNVSHSFRDHKCAPGSAWQAMKSLFNCTQKEDEDIKTHHDRFTQKVEVLNNCGTDTGAITGECQKDFKTATPEMSEEDEIKKADSDAAIEKDEKLITKLKHKRQKNFQHVAHWPIVTKRITAIQWKIQMTHTHLEKTSVQKLNRKVMSA